MRLRTCLFLSIAMLTACDRKPPSEADMTAALQTAFDIDAQKGGQALHITALKAHDCESTAMVGPVVFSCDVVLTIGSRESPPRRVLFHQSEKGWMVPP